MRRTILGAAIVIAALALTGCTAASGGSSESGADGGGIVAEPLPATGQQDGGTLGGSERDDSTSPDADRAVVTIGSLAVTADDPIEAARDAVRIATEAGGRVDARQEYAADGDRGASAVLTLRIPADRLDGALDELKALGTADEVTITSSDVDDQKQDLDARISALSASIGRLTALVSTAATTTDLIELETEISSRQAELEMLQAQQRSLDDQISMSTLTLTLTSDDAVAPKPVPGDFWSGLGTGWAAFLAFWSSVLVVLGLVFPWVVLLAAGALVLRFVLRRAAARRSAAAPEAPAPSAIPAP